MLIGTMPDVLSWAEPEADLNRVHHAFVDMLSDALGALLRDVKTLDPAVWARLDAALRSADDGAFMRVLQAPEVSYRLIWRRELVVDRANFIADALRIEAIRTPRVGGAMHAGRESGGCPDAWTALGDMGFGQKGERRENPALATGLPFDVMSPHAAAVDLGGPSAIAPRRLFTPDELSSVVGKLDAALAGIAQTGPVFRDFVRRFNFVLIAQIDRDDEDLFTSGSTGQYIGRSFVTNPHMPLVRPIDLAEALVHEGIHSLLYMQERAAVWVHRQDLYDPQTVRVVSPWTGSKLGARPFLQACFVWYGLIQFWAAALEAGAFAADQIRERMMLATRGFLAGPLEQHVADFRDGIDDAILDAVREMQRRILHSWPDVMG